MTYSPHVLSIPDPQVDTTCGRSNDRLTRRTFLCSDIVGYTDLLARLGDLRALTMVRRHDEIVTRCAHQYGTELLELRGDSFFASFTHPDDALACAVSVQQDLARDRAQNGGVHVRIGIHSGDVIEDRQRHFGLNVVVAFRVSDAAGADEIICTGEVPAAEFPVRRCERLRLKGVPYTVSIVAVDWSGAGRIRSTAAFDREQMNGLALE